MVAARRHEQVDHRPPGQPGARHRLPGQREGVEPGASDPMASGSPPNCWSSCPRSVARIRTATRSASTRLTRQTALTESFATHTSGSAHSAPATCTAAFTTAVRFVTIRAATRPIIATRIPSPTGNLGGPRRPGPARLRRPAARCARRPPRHWRRTRAETVTGHGRLPRLDRDQRDGVRDEQCHGEAEPYRRGGSGGRRQTGHEQRDGQHFDRRQRAGQRRDPVRRDQTERGGRLSEPVRVTNLPERRRSERRADEDLAEHQRHRLPSPHVSPPNPPEVRIGAGRRLGLDPAREEVLAGHERHHPFVVHPGVEPPVALPKDRPEQRFLLRVGVADA